jgi:hypothetical protein
MKPTLVLLTCMLVIGMAGPAVAGKPGGSGISSVIINEPAPYHFGQQVTTTVQAPLYPNGRGPYISLDCYQGAAKVLGDMHAGFTGGWYYGEPWSLGPTQSWPGGAADCTFTVYHFGKTMTKSTVDATLSFHVDS